MSSDHDARLDALEEKIARIDAATSGLLEAWNTANGVVKFVKWAAALAAAFSTIYVACAVGKDIIIHNLQESLK